MKFQWQKASLNRHEFRIADSSAMLMSLRREGGEWTAMCLSEVLTGLGDMTEDEAKQHAEKFLALVIEKVLKNLRERC